uniref:Uncharacterized protein n=1 Tax=Aegilops tauschii subsp. strangulata TaxID=200361 RepID=A0A452XZ27_AEGTS
PWPTSISAISVTLKPSSHSLPVSLPQSTQRHHLSPHHPPWASSRTPSCSKV